MAQTRNTKSKGKGLKRLFLRNYQGHKKSTIKFHPGINVITGNSHNGKSSIVRALKKLVFNRPMGAKFYSNFGPSNGRTVIKATFFDGKKVLYHVNVNKKTKDGKTVKTATSQRYDLGGHIFTGLRGKIPDAVVDDLNLSDINFQYQHDQPLLLETSNTKLAQIISDITKLDKAYEAKAELQRRLRKARTEEAVSTETIAELKKDLKKYDKLDTIIGTLTNLGISEERIKQIDTGINNLQELQGVTDEMNAVETRLTAVSSTTKTIESKEEHVATLSRGISGLSAALESSLQTLRVASELEEAAEDLRKILVRAEECPTCGQDTTGL